MIRIRITLVAVLVAMALCAVVAGSASAAALPELTKPGTETAVAGEIAGKSKEKTKTVLETANGTTVKCEKATSKGGVASNTKESAGTVVSFTGCTESLFGGSCKSTNTTVAGEIKTAEISTKIGYIVGSKKTEVGMELYPTKTNEALKIEAGNKGPSFVEFSCTGGFAKIEVQGAVIGTLGNGEHNKAVKSLSLNFAKGATAGSQKVTEIEGGKMKNVHLESNLNGGTFENSNQQGEGFIENIVSKAVTEMELKA